MMRHNKGDVKIQSLLNCVAADFTVCGLLMPLALFSAFCACLWNISVIIVSSSVMSAPVINFSKNSWGRHGYLLCRPIIYFPSSHSLFSVTLLNKAFSARYKCKFLDLVIRTRFL